MDEKEVYMLQRDHEESNRLNEQSKLLRALFNNFLIHPSIPRDELREIADVGTGTGVWIDEVQQELQPTLDGQNVQFIGFDISDAQFPRQKRAGQDFFVHDAVQAFPAQYHHIFDLVHIRFLSYGIKANQLENVVNSVLQILRPGGYLQWEEIDAIDSWRDPVTSKTQQVTSWLVSERIARGLTPAVTAPLIRTLQTRSVPMEPGSINPMCWTNDLLRIYYLESISTYQHSSPEVKSLKNQWTDTVAIQLLRSAASRRSVLAKAPETSSSQAEQLQRDISELNQAIQTVKREMNTGVHETEAMVTRIVARKAMLFGKDDLWASNWHHALLTGQVTERTERKGIGA